MLGAASLAVAAGRLHAAPRRIGLLSVTTAEATEASRTSFAAGLAEVGLLEGRDYRWLVRYADNRPEQLDALAAELLAARPALVIAPGQAAMSAMRAGTGIPVLGMGDLVPAGLAKSLREPGGRATGVSILWEPLNLKRMEMLAELLPRRGRVLVLAEPSLARRPDYLAELTAAAKRVGLSAQMAYASDAAQIEAAFARATRERFEGVNQLNSPLLWGQRQVSFAAAIKHRLPAIYQWAEAAGEGGLVAYGPRNALMRRQLMRLAARVLAGEDPARIPIEQPTDIQLTLNAGVAARIGLRLPRRCWRGPTR
jgi:putative ABC transport system substrate-binding protein